MIFKNLYSFLNRNFCHIFQAVPLKPKWLPQVVFEVLLLTMLSVVMAVVMFVIFPPFNFFPDSEHYLRTALAILGRPGEFYYYRTWGYPLFMILTGVPSAESFYPLIVTQILLAASIPVIIFLTLRPINPRMAFIVSIVTILSGAPYLFERLVMTDQVSMFLYYLLVFSAALYIYKQSNPVLGLIVIVGFLLYLMRPAAMLMCACVLVSLLVFCRSEWRRLLAASLIFMALVGGFSVFQDNIIGQYAALYPNDKPFVKGAMSGRMLFWNVYGVGPLYTSSKISKEDGPCIREMYDNLYMWFKENPAAVSSPSGQDNPRINVDKLFAETNLGSHWIMWQALDQKLGGFKSDQLFFCAAIDAIKAHPKTLLLFYDGFYQFFLSGDVVYNDGFLRMWDEKSISTAMTSIYISGYDSFPERLKNELLTAQQKPTGNEILNFLFYYQTVIKILATIFAIMFIPACMVMDKRTRNLAFIIFLILIYQASISVVFAAPHYRYMLPQVPLLIMLAGLGIEAFTRLRDRRLS